jgi:hypothetical protein
MAGRRRSQRHFGDGEAAVLLDAIRACRSACRQAQAQAPIGSPVYVEAGRLMDAIDGVAEVLTGRRDALWGRVAGHIPVHPRDTGGG